MITKVSVSFLVVALTVILLSFSGFITNFLSPSISISTLFIDILLGAALAHVLLTLGWHIYAGQGIKKDLYFFLISWLFLLVGTLFKMLFIDTNPLWERMLGLRNNHLYSIYLIYIPLLFVKEQYNRAIINVILGLGILLCLYAIFQFSFSDYLPMSLLALKGEGVFTFFNRSLVRPTALLGNTIIFASYTIILFSFFFIRYLRTRKKRYLLLLLIVCVANYMTYTRASLVGLGLSAGTILLLLYGRFTLLFILKATLVLAITIGSVSYIGYYFKDSFLVRRVTGREASTVSSTQMHYQQIDDSIDYLRGKPFTGTGVGSQGPSGDYAKRIITDGYWFQLFLENGLLLGTIYLLFYIISCFYALIAFFLTRDPFLRELCLAFLAFSIYFFAASFINSAYAGRVNFMVYWIIFGVLLAQQFIVKEKKYAVSGN